MDFLDIAEKHVETNLNFDAVKDYVPYIIDFNIDDLKTATLPGIAEESNGVWIYSPYEDEVEETVNELFYGIDSDEEETVETSANTVDGENTIEDDKDSNENEVSEEIKIEVLNGSGSSSKLSEVVAKLEAEGFTINQTGNTSMTSNTTIIDRGNISEKTLSKIQDMLHIENITTGSSKESNRLTIILGTDYVM